MLNTEGVVFMSPTTSALSVTIVPEDLFSHGKYLESETRKFFFHNVNPYKLLEISVQKG